MKNPWSKKLPFFYIFSFFLFMFFPQLHAAAGQNQTQVDKNSYLFVQGATEAILSKNQNDYTLTLKNVNPYVTAFTERPARKVMTMSLKKYLELWNKRTKNSFQNDPPNAALHAISMKDASNEKVENYILELYDVHFDAANKILTYKAKPLKLSAELSSESSLSLRSAVLFIDRVCLSCW